MEVTPDGEGIGTAQICAGDIASILEPEVSYEFSFYAKADPQTPEGTVELQITSASSDWASSQAAAVTYAAKLYWMKTGSPSAVHSLFRHMRSMNR